MRDKTHHCRQSNEAIIIIITVTVYDVLRKESRKNTYYFFRWISENKKQTLSVSGTNTNKIDIDIDSLTMCTDILEIITQTTNLIPFFDFSLFIYLFDFYTITITTRICTHLQQTAKYSYIAYILLGILNIEMITTMMMMRK